VWKGWHFVGWPRAALSLATPLCGTILADWMPNRNILVDWPGRWDKALKTGTVPAKLGRMVSLVFGLFCWRFGLFWKNKSGNPVLQVFPFCGSVRFIQWCHSTPRDEHGSGLDRTGSGLKPILAGIGLDETEKIFVVLMW